MARARNIKPGMYKNEDLAECSIWARFIFPGLWMLADREGRLEDRPKRIKAELLAFDSQDVEPLLNELQARKFLVRYRNPDGSFIQISKFEKHQTPHYSEKPSVIKPPGFQESPAHEGTKTPGTLQEKESKSQSSRGVRNPLTPDSLNPDSGLSDFPTADSRILTPVPTEPVAPGVASAPPVVARPKAKSKPKPESPSAATWEAYAEAYEARYSSPPVRNEKVNGQLAQVVKRLGSDEAPMVAGFFLGHQNALYVRAMHPVDLLLRDAEKLRTEWATNRQVTQTQASMADRTQTNANAFGALIAESKAKEIADGVH